MVHVSLLTRSWCYTLAWGTPSVKWTANKTPNGSLWPRTSRLHPNRQKMGLTCRRGGGGKCSVLISTCLFLVDCGRRRHLDAQRRSFSFVGGRRPVQVQRAPPVGPPPGAANETLRMEQVNVSNRLWDHLKINLCSALEASGPAKVLDSWARDWGSGPTGSNAEDHFLGGLVQFLCFHGLPMSPKTLHKPAIRCITTK